MTVEIRAQSTQILDIQGLPQQLARKGFGYNLLWTVGGSFSIALMGLASGILAARLLGPEGRGQLGAIQLWGSLFATLALFGLPEALVYFSSKEPREAGRFLGSALMMVLISSALFASAGYLLLPTLLSAQGSDVISAARWYLLLVPVFALVVMPYQHLRYLRDMTAWNVLRALPGLSWLLVLIGAALFTRATPQSVSAAYVMVLASLVFPVFLVVRRWVPGPFFPDFTKCTKMLRYGLPTVTAIIPQAFNLRLDQILMAAFLPATTLGLYVVAVAWSSAMNPLVNSIGYVLFPQVASHHEPVQQAAFLGRGTRLGALVSLVVGMVLILITPWLFPVFFGAKFTAAIPAALVLVVAGGISGLNTILREVMRGLGHPKTVLWSELAGLTVTGVALLSLLGPLGILGAAIASLLGYAAVQSYLLVRTYQLTSLSPATLLIPSPADFSLAWNRMQSLMGKMLPR